ncbi:ATP synthase subunit C [Thermofilum pendens]|uniref:H+-transporting two-sector ATPase, C subunit n=1 Tax=Thermofilum pendens (strain DSM 2475 / Hrk 5) TaxID=368408 RepID=A1RX17_THEPD|nr:ATP synthase subunit C [Thermofilum pendens]ABL77747.1 H+-transporting two-sector ATPase, C subunit [Thermofilum pendens Hrk 5]
MRQKRLAYMLLAVNVAIVVLATTVMASAISRATAYNVQGQEAAKKLELPDAIALLAGAIAVVGSTIASGIALRSVATAGFAAVAEKPELTTWMLIMGGLAEGIAVYGLLLAILILGKI